GGWMVASLLIVGLAGRADEKSLPRPGKDAAPLPLERVMFRDDAGTERAVLGRVLVEAADGGLLVQGQDGRLWTVEKERLSSRGESGERFTPLSAETLGRQLAAELGADAEVVTTKHYVIVTRAGRAYAQWCGALFERLFTAFHNYWKQR